MSSNINNQSHKNDNNVSNSLNFNSDIVIGLEVHISLKTKSKLFCACKNPSFHGKNIDPNINVCPICLGHPGAKPSVNKKAIIYALKLANALNCKIPNKVLFDRKNYFYPDLVKNYQITQDELVIGEGGKLQIGIDEYIDLDHIHLEEDPGSMVIENSTTLIDYNRSGTPLIELVTKPNMSEPAQAREFLKKLVILLEYLGIFDRYNCTLKADANVSIKESNYTRVEIKNVNGFKDIEQALEYEINRHKELISKGEVIKMETRGWDGSKTNFQRTKEAAMDYGYYPENDIAEIEISDELIKEAIVEESELYYSKIKNIIDNHKADLTDLEIIYDEKQLGLLFEKSITKLSQSNKSSVQNIANYFRNKLLTILNQLELSISSINLNEKNLIDLMNLYFEKKVDNKTNAKLLREVIENSDMDLLDYVEKNNLIQSNDTSLIEEFAKQVIKENEVAVNQYKDGDAKSINFLVGQVMKQSKGKANPGLAKQVLEELLK